jgi:hypothetical protein
MICMKNKYSRKDIQNGPKEDVYNQSESFSDTHLFIVNCIIKLINTSSSRLSLLILI